MWVVTTLEEIVDDGSTDSFPYFIAFESQRGVNRKLSSIYSRKKNAKFPEKKRHPWTNQSLIESKQLFVAAGRTTAIVGVENRT